MKKFIKNILYFTLTLISLSLLGLCCLLGGAAFFSIIDYLIINCPDLMLFIFITILCIGGGLIGWDMFITTLNYFKNNR